MAFQSRSSCYLLRRDYWCGIYCFLNGSKAELGNRHSSKFSQNLRFYYYKGVLDSKIRRWLEQNELGQMQEL